MIDLLQEIAGNLRRNKLRTFLTGFAVSWGIFMLIVLLGAGNGIIHALEQSMDGLALNVIKVWPGWTSQPYEGLKAGRNIELDHRDLTLATTLFPDEVEDVGGHVEKQGVTISSDNDYVTLSVEGVSPNYRSMQGIRLPQGRFVNALDIRERRKSIVLHQQTAEILFPRRTDDAVGRKVKVDGLVFQVVGLYKDLGNLQSSAYIPLTTLQAIYPEENHLSQLSLMTRGLDDETKNTAFETHYRKAMGTLHRFAPDDTGIWLHNRFTQQRQQHTAYTILTNAIWVVGILTLLSGIVGVSNIMLITVKERTHEIGIRKALGAKPRTILGQIIAESVVITTFFGYLGMFAGIAATEYMNAVAGRQTMDAGLFSQTVFLNPTVDLSIAFQATLALIVAGTLAGFFPARKAVLIRPIEALRAD